jgi:hypothetical protein
MTAALPQPEPEFPRYIELPARDPFRIYPPPEVCQCTYACYRGGYCTNPPDQEDMLCERCRGVGLHCHALGDYGSECNYRGERLV